jgi:ATP-dependent DNA helicase RecG
MIGLDSPVESVLGDIKPAKRKAIVEGLGLRTVGDLLTHFPRRYLKTGELTRVDELQEGQLLTLVGEIVESKQHNYQDRRTGRLAYRLETVLRTDGPPLRMTFFAQAKHVADWNARRLSVGRRGIFLGKAGRFGGKWQLTNPQMALFGSGEEDAAQMSLDAMRDYYPIYPLTKGVDSWDLQRAVTFALTVLDDPPDLIPESVRERHRIVGVRDAFAWIQS